ncbi:MAG: aryl-sulfate sulfotransferase [Candidatus Hodarchaeales archaeon]|jgi:hypothetical protein
MRAIKKNLFPLFVTLLISSFFYYQAYINTDITEEDRAQVKEFHNQAYINTDITEEDRTRVKGKITQFDTLPPYLFNISSTGNEFDGFNAFHIRGINITTQNAVLSRLIITDMDGNILHDNEKPSSFIFKMVNTTTFLFRSLENVSNPEVCLWNFETGVFDYLDFNGHHEIEYNHNNNTIFTLNKYSIEINGTTIVYDPVEEYNLTGNLVWTVNPLDFISIDQWDGLCGTGDNIGLTHSNSIFYDEEEDVIYYNVRNVNTFYKIDHKTGKVLWGLGEYGNFSLFDRNSNPRDSLFYHAHAVEKVDENTFILFDNDYHNKTDLENKRSRIMEITIDETRMVANESWSWIAPPDYYSSYYGDADRLPNGNRLGTFGSDSHPNSNIGARLVEVNSTGNTVWEMNFPRDSGIKVKIYRIERFHFSPIIKEHPDISAIPSNNILLNWTTWYNFRTRGYREGNYTIYLDGELIAEGTHIFDKFWRSTQLEVNIGKLDVGEYNLTLVLTDGEGHFTTDSFTINIQQIVLERQDQELASIEIGQSDTSIKWNGYADQEYSVTLYVNNTIVSNLSWSGGEITYDLNSLLPGFYQIELLVFLTSNSILFSDMFWVTVHPSNIPIILSSPKQELGIVWNETPILFWEIFDHSPVEYKIFVNQEKLLAKSWQNQSQVIHWKLPVFDEGAYNVTLCIFDIVGDQASSSILLTINPPVHPVIVDSPPLSNIEWGENVKLIWRVHGGNKWIFFRNDNKILEGQVENNNVEIQIDWYVQGWSLSNFSLCVEVANDNGDTTKSFMNLVVSIITGDPYANVIEENSIWYINGENALGAPDGKYASIFTDYGLGSLLLDMGVGEEIIDGNGVDFDVIAKSGEYEVYVGNSLSVPLIDIGYASDNTSFDLTDFNLSSIRYIKIEYRSGTLVELDAIVATNYYNNQDYENPIITEIADFWVWENQTEISLIWIIVEKHPLSYTIFVNGKLNKSSYWNDSVITIVLNIPSKFALEVKLVVYDLFGNKAEDYITITIHSQPTTTPITKINKSSVEKLPAPFLFCLVLALPFYYILKKKKE